MTHLSRRQLGLEAKKYTLDSLSYIFKEIDTKQEMDKFLNSILTETERLMISKRVVAAFLLRHNIEEAKISDTLKLTPATISRLKLWIQTRSEGFELVFKRLEKARRMLIVKKIMYKLLNYALNAALGVPPKLKFPASH